MRRHAARRTRARLQLQDAPLVSAFSALGGAALGAKPADMIC